jgi:hypothetical protein
MTMPRNRKEATGTQYEDLFNTPEHWPDSVRHLTFDDELLGIDAKTYELYWNGNRVKVSNRFDLTKFQLSLASITASGAALGGLAAAASAGHVLGWW